MDIWLTPLPPSMSTWFMDAPKEGVAHRRQEKAEHPRWLIEAAHASNCILRLGDSETRF